MACIYPTQGQDHQDGHWEVRGERPLINVVCQWRGAWRAQCRTGEILSVLTRNGAAAAQSPLPDEGFGCLPLP